MFLDKAAVKRLDCDYCRVEQSAGLTLELLVVICPTGHNDRYRLSPLPSPVRCVEPPQDSELPLKWAFLRLPYSYLVQAIENGEYEGAFGSVSG
jgi:hypothetical protein